MIKDSAFGENQQPFIGITSFMRLPVTRDLSQIDVVILGVPLDSGSSYRSGSRLGPRKIREASVGIWGFNPSQLVKPLEVLKVVDYGDVAVVPPSLETTLKLITEEANRILSAGVKIIALGGDHSLTFSMLEAYHQHYGPLSVIHLDSHPDTWPYEYENQPHSHGTPFRRALESGFIRSDGYVQVGIRGSLYSRDDLEMSAKLGAKVITTRDLFEKGTSWIVEEIQKTVKGPTYLSLDIDILDPAFAPGTGTPEVGGVSSYQLLELIRQLKGLELVGFDIVEVNPAFDSGEITAIIAANLGFEFLSLLAITK